MAEELVINVVPNGYRIALLKKGALVEYHIEKKNNRFTVGDIYLGTIRSILLGLNAGFVDIGPEKDAFLHYFDLGPKFKSLKTFLNRASHKRNAHTDITKISLEADIDKLGKIDQVLTKGEKVLVQVVKEPISNKGPRLSCELSIAGRYIILVPFSNEISISKKIDNVRERKRLSRLIASIKPKNFGIIVRTASSGKEVAELDKDLQQLLKKWNTGVASLKSASPRDKIIGEINRASSILRDVLSESFDNIVVDDQATYEEIKNYTRRIAPDKEKIVKLYNQKTKIFEKYRIERQIKALFGQVVNIEGGGYLIIEHTEAMHVIDVNSGSKIRPEDDAEATALKVNLAAAEEVARQLRLRDMGGIIVIDFIGLKQAESKRQLFQAMKDHLKEDRSKTTVLPLSKFSVMQLTRQRVRPEMNVSTKELCPSCGGTGQIDASILVSEQIERNIKNLLLNQNEQELTLFIHPYVYAYFTKGFFSKRMQWLWRYKKWVHLEQDSSLGITDFKFTNKEGEEIDVE